MTVQIAPKGGSLNQRVSENVTTMLFRLGWKQKDLAQAMGTTGATISRKLKNLTEWSLTDIELMAPIMTVEVSELLGDLPPFDVWRACRDSNPKPSDP